jgi:hypothetical protein
MDLRRLLNTPPRRRLLSEIPETPLLELRLLQQSTQSWDSQNGSRPAPSCESLTLSITSSQSQLPFLQTPQKRYAPHTTHSDRIRIKTALDFNIPPNEIQKKYGFTAKQIQLAKQRLTLQKRHSKLKSNTPTRRRLEEWLLQSPSHRHISFKHILELAPKLELKGYGPQAIRTVFKLIGYGRRVAKRKGFSDDPKVMAKRVAFAQGLTWTPEKLFHQIFSDEVWASEGAHTQSFVTVKEDGSDRLDLAYVQHEYCKLSCLDIPRHDYHRRKRAGHVLREGLGEHEFI